MGTDDESGWNEILVDGWGPLVLAAVVERVERAMVGRRGVLVRALHEEAASPGHAACVEEVHEQVMDAIRRETGADLEGLGSQAAWATYDQVWGALQQAWGTPAPRAPRPGLTAVASARRDEVVRLVRLLTPAAAMHAGADVGTMPYTPLTVGRTVYVDVEGLFAYLARDSGEVTDADRTVIDRLLLWVQS